MNTPLQPLTLLVVAIAGWLQRDQQAAMVYVLEENRVLKARLRGKKLRLTDAERRRLAVKGKALGQKLLAEVAGIVTPETLLGKTRKRSSVFWSLPTACRRGSISSSSSTRWFITIFRGIRPAISSGRILMQEEWHGTTRKPSNFIRTQVFQMEWFEQYMTREMQTRRKSLPETTLSMR